MKTEKKILAGIAVTALTMGTAMPALALENEFHGMFRLRGIVSNFDDSNGGTQYINANTGAGGTLTKSNPATYTFVEQRARILYAAKANVDLKLVTQFEIDSRWGDNSYNSNNTTRNNGGGVGADQVNLETKNVYLDFNIPSTPVNVKLGIQNWGGDKYKGIIFNNDAAGLVVNGKLDNGALNFGYFRFDDATTPASATYISSLTYIANGTGTETVPVGGLVNTAVGKRTRDFLTFGGKYEITKDFKVGGDYFLIYSDIMKNTQAVTHVHTLGANAEYTFGDAKIDGFFLYQTGELGSSAVTAGQHINAFAANVGARTKLGPGTLRANLIYVSGDSNPSRGERKDFQIIMEKRGDFSAANDFGAAEMQIMLDGKYNQVNSGRAVVYNLNNSSQGFKAAFIGYDLSIGKFFVNSNVGFGAVVNDLKLVPGSSHASRYLGTEINTEIGYKLFDNMTVSYLAAYMILGDYFSKQADGFTKDPDNPYSTKVMFNYAF